MDPARGGRDAASRLLLLLLALPLGLPADRLPLPLRAGAMPRGEWWEVRSGGAGAGAMLLYSSWG